MKKLIFINLIVIVLNFAGHSIDDTLRYFLKKQLYKAPPSPPNTFHPMFQLLAGTVINTEFTHVGSIFKNNSPVGVVGLEARVMKPAFSVGNNGNMKTRLYLAKVENGLPVFPLLDSTVEVNTNLSVSLPTDYNGQLIGANLIHGTQTVTTDFAVLIRCTSLQQGDAILVFRTNGYKPGATSPQSNGYTFGDGLGIVRHNGQFKTTRDFVHPEFGYDTDYEFCVAPRVKYDLQVSQIESLVQYGACCWQAFTNTNTSTYAWTSPQFNFTQFNNYLKPFNNLFPAAFPQDTALVWNMGDGSPAMYPAPFSTLVPLGFYGGDCNKFHYGTITGNFKKMAPDNPVTEYTAQVTFTSSTVWCMDTVGTGIKELSDLSAINAWPNPTANQTLLSGLKGINTVSIFSMTGTTISSWQTRNETIKVDLSTFSAGVYLVRISDSENHTRVIKLVRE